MERTQPLVIKTDWAGFRERLLKYAKLLRDRRDDLLFRGHADSNWLLESTLDRERTFLKATQRELFVQKLLTEFRSQLIALADDRRKIPSDEALELLGRHFGLPLPLLDWTRSPWVAAYFAIERVEPSVKRVTVWRLDRNRVEPFQDGVDFIDDESLLRFNRRALHQRSVFLRVTSRQQAIEKTIGRSLIRYDIIASDRQVALADLNEMGINAARLFADEHGAARCAWTRSDVEWDEQ